MRTRITFTKHAILDKFPLLARRDFPLTRKDIRAVIKSPEHIDTISDHPKTIASSSIDERHILRVVYKQEHGIIKVITFYPAEKGRYY